MNAANLMKVQRIVQKLVDIANGEDKKLTAKEAKGVVFLLDLLEGFIAKIEDSYVALEYLEGEANE